MNSDQVNLIIQAVEKVVEEELSYAEEAAEHVNSGYILAAQDISNTSKLCQEHLNKAFLLLRARFELGWFFQDFFRKEAEGKNNCKYEAQCGQG